MKAYAVTDIGRKRQVNQDYVFASEQAVGNIPNLLVVADGMGGHNAGDFASSYAVKILLETIRSDSESNPVKVIRNAIETANRMLMQQAEQHDGMQGMGTTMVIATVIDTYAYIANVGDSRLYILDATLQQVTKDHSFVQEMVRMGEITQEEANYHPDKNIITRALGATETVKIDFFDFKLNPNALILLCSDGLTNMVPDEQITKVLRSGGTLKGMAHQLIDMANANGGKDNIAVVLVEPGTKEVEVC